MLVMAYLHWWYGPGWLDLSNRVWGRVKDTYLGFSVPILARTMLKPWRRIISPPGVSLDQKLKTMIDNLVSRGVGFTVRLLALIAATALMLFYGVVGGLLLLVWPLVPVLGPALIVGGLL